VALKYREGTTAQTNTLADLATYYWVTDLKTTGTTATNNVPASAIDPASWQHVNFAAISFGTRARSTWPTRRRRSRVLPRARSAGRPG